MGYSKVYKIFFSPTYSTKEVLDYMTRDEDYNTWDIDLSDENLKETRIDDGFCLFAVPCYAGRVPALAVERLKLIKGNVNAAVIMTFGNRDYDDGLVEMEDIVTSNGFKLMGAMAVVTNHSVFRSVGKGRPDQNDLEVIDDFMDKLMVKKEVTKLNIKGNRPYKPYKKVYFKIDFDEAKCISCGACENMCPAGAINAKHETDLDKCISCLRCIKVCSENARTLSAEVLAKEESFYERCKERKEIEYFI